MVPERFMSVESTLGRDGQSDLGDSASRTCAADGRETLLLKRRTRWKRLMRAKRQAVPALALRVQRRYAQT
jgi:hypothetical protein